MLCDCVCWALPGWVGKVTPKWQVLSHPTGQWVINTGQQRLVMPPIPAKWLCPLHGKRPSYEEVLDCLRKGNEADQCDWSEIKITQMADRLAEVPDLQSSRHSKRALWLRIPLISAYWTSALARPLEFWTKKWGLVLLVVPGLAGPLLLPWAARMPSSASIHWLPAFGMFFAGAILHELGHAAALSAQGYPAGGIGGGMLFVIPVLHNDVSAISMLKTSGKLRVDLAGVVFQAAYGGLLVLGAAALTSFASSMLLAAKMTWLAVGWSLIPFIRADGYWALCDALGLKDLSSPLEQPIGPTRWGILLVHRVLNVIFLLLVSLLLPLTWASRLTAIVPETWRLVAWVVLGVGLLLIWWSMGRKVFGLLAALRVDLRRVIPNARPD